MLFGEYELDPSSPKLFRDGWPVKIQPQPLRVLCTLLEQPGEIVSREHLRARVWGDATYVEFDQGLNYSIRQIRLALHDNASQPVYIETLPKQGYRFIAPLVSAASGSAAGTTIPETAVASTVIAGAESKKKMRWLVIMAGVALAGIAAFLVTLAARTMRDSPKPLPGNRVDYTQLTDFTDSAVAPALSPDGRLVAFIRGSKFFGTSDQVYLKVLPNGEAKQLTHDRRLKYNLAFSPDGAQIAYSVLEPHSSFDTYTISILGGEPHLFLNNAAGLTWLDQQQILFSQIRSGVHMGIVTGSATGGHFRDVYFPPKATAMAHYSFPSPDRKSALLVEMNDGPGYSPWEPCRLISLSARMQQAQLVGPAGPCTSAGWSPDGSWMYFSAALEGDSHLWRQRFPKGQPEQITFGPNEEQGVAVEPDGRSIITSMGSWENALWIHDSLGDRQLTSEGQIVAFPSLPSFNRGAQFLYYLLRRQSGGPGAELWRMSVDSGKSEVIFPGVFMLAYDISPDDKQVVYSTASADGKPDTWLAPVDRAAPAEKIGSAGGLFPHFGLHGQIVFQMEEGGGFSYLEQMNADGTHRTKIFERPITVVDAMSPGRRWVIAEMIPDRGAGPARHVAIPLEGGPSQILCTGNCRPAWSPNGKLLLVDVEAASETGAGRSLAIPVGPEESLFGIPPQGIEPFAEPSVVRGAQSVNRAELVPGNEISRFAYVQKTAHRNLYRISVRE